MISQLSHLKLEKGSILVIQSNEMSRKVLEEFRKALQDLELGFKVPIIAFDEDSVINVSERDEVIKQLDSITDVQNGRG